MSTSPIVPKITTASAINYASAVATALLTSPGQNTSTLWPVQSPGIPTWLKLPGLPGLEKNGALPNLQQGSFLEQAIGPKMADLMRRRRDLDEKILSHLDLNRVGNHSKLVHAPRAIALASDCIKVMSRIQAHALEITQVNLALTQDIQILVMVLSSMQTMLQSNIGTLSNLLNQICNWGLPELASLPILLGGQWTWGGYPFNALTGFTFESSLAGALDSTLHLVLDTLPQVIPDITAILAADAQAYPTTFSFGSCVNLMDAVAIPVVTPTTLTTDGDTYTQSTIATPQGGSLGTPSEYDDPAYIAEMQASTSPVYDPDTLASAPDLSIPVASTLISNYALSPTTYAANICSAVTALNPVVVHPGDADYGTSPSTMRQNLLRSLLVEQVNLAAIVASGYDGNLMAAWLFYLQANRAGRAGSWLVNFQSVYASLILPSLAYLAATSIPWNTVLGGSGTTDAPQAIPLTSTLKADATNHLLWQLSYVEASLLGYTRTTLWDAAKDNTYLSGATGADLDYVATTLSATTNTQSVGNPPDDLVPVTYPSSISGSLSIAIGLAAANLLNNPLYLSSLPQYRYTYDIFATASLVAGGLQFWREWVANLLNLLAGDAYTVDFAVTYPAILDAAIDPLADATPYTLLVTDAATRNRAWVPGSSLLPIPTALPSSTVNTSGSVTLADSGFGSGSFDAAAFLSRSDVQALGIPTQIAMLRTNASYSVLASRRADVLARSATLISAASAIASDNGFTGWDVVASGGISVAPGQAAMIPFDTVNLDQTGFAKVNGQITIASAGIYNVVVSSSWNSGEGLGTRVLTLLNNGVVLETAEVDATSGTPYVVELSTSVPLMIGDVLTISASHSLAKAATVLAGAEIMGVIDTGAAASDPSTTDTSNSPQSGAYSFVTASAIPLYSAVSVTGAGTIAVVDITNASVTPYVDGVTLEAAPAPGQQVTTAIGYGTVISLLEQTLTAGALVWVGPSGGLTQNLAVAYGSHWRVCIGKATSVNEVLFAPHLPTLS